MYLDTKMVLASTELQRAYNFEVVLPDIGSVDNLSVSACIQKARFGNYNFTDLTERKRGTYKSFAAGLLDLGPLDINLLATADTQVTTYFQAWRDLIVDPTGFYYPKSNYVFTAYVFLYDTQGNTTDSYSIVNVFPKTFPSFDLDYATSRELRFDVSLVYDYITQGVNS